MLRRPPLSPNPAAELAETLLVAGLRAALRRPDGLPPSDAPTPLPSAAVLRLLRHPALPPAAKLHLLWWAPAALPTSLPLLAAAPPADLRPLLRRALAGAADPAAFRSLLDALVRSSRFDCAIAALDEAEQLGVPQLLDSRAFTSIIVVLLNKSQLDLALAITRKLPHPPAASACNKLLVALRRADMREEFCNLFEELTQKDFVFMTPTYNICIHAFGSWGQLGVALRLFKAMKITGNPDVCTYNSVLHAFCSVGRIEDALTVFREMKGPGLEPDRFTYQTLIHGCCKTYRVDEAVRVFREMKYNCVAADTVVYNSLIDGLLKVRKLDDACYMFEEMVSDGVRASCYTYNILIDGLIRNGRALAGFTLFTELKKKGSFVDGVSYSIIISQYCKEGAVEEALDLAKEMEERGFLVDLVTITSLLIALYKKGRWDSADQLMKHLRDSSILPDILRWKANMEASTRGPQDKGKDYTAIFPSVGSFSDIMSWVDPSPEEDNDNDLNVHPRSDDEWSSSPSLDRIAEKFESLDDSRKFTVCRGQRVEEKGMKSFDTDMTNTYLSIFLAKGKLSLSCKLFEIFTLLGKTPVSYTYNTLMSSFVKNGYLNEAWGVLQEMGDNLCPSDIATYNLIIQGLGKMGKADLASAVLDQLLKNGGYLDIVMYNTLINALGKAGRFDEANKLFKQMMESGINPDVVTFNTLIEVHAKSGRAKDAKKYLSKMVAAGFSPIHVSDTTLDLIQKFS